MSGFVSDSLMGVFYAVPFLVLFFSKLLDRQIKAAGLSSLRAVDILTPYLLCTVYIFGQMTFQWPLFLYFIILLSVVGIILASYFAFKIKELYYKKFFRVWWRIVFLLSILIHTAVGGIALYNQITG